MAFCYLALGALLGLYMALFPISRAVLFGHVHLLLLGFMSMSIFGIGYHILPRFNNRPLPWPKLVPLHFALAQIGLVGMIMTSPGTGLPPALFWSASAVEAASIGLFVVNLQALLLAGRQVAAATQTRPLGELSPASIVGEVLARWPAARDYFVRQGFSALADPSHGGPGGPRVTIEQACRKHGKDPREFLDGLARHLALGEPGAGGGGGVGPQDRIGDLVARHPATRAVFERYYGAGCFSCAGQAYETVAETAAMHGVALERILADLNDAVKRE